LSEHTIWRCGSDSQISRESVVAAPSYAKMNGGVRSILKVTPKPVIRGLRTDLVYDLLRASRSVYIGVALHKVPAQPVRVGFDAPVQWFVVPEGPVLDTRSFTAVGLGPGSVAAEACGGVPNDGFGGRIRVLDPVPVHGGAGVAAGAQGVFVDLDEVAVPGQERGDAVDCGLVNNR
jgi:hypothetical protein